ncbi:MAG TPA: hypothetical protein VIY27_11570 [Myxococcota bacterium]
MRQIEDELCDWLRRAPIDARAVCAHLDSLSSAERIRAIHSLDRVAQRNLFEGVVGLLPLRLVDLVPASVADLAEVRHFGRNSLPVCSRFEKRFCRPRGADPSRPDRLFGFNHQRLAPLTGPGYFVATQDPSRGEVRVDYAQLPDARPEAWPEIRRNEAGLARLVFGGLVDTLRRVSEHVSVGAAARHGRDLASRFVLCRED